MINLQNAFSIIKEHRRAFIVFNLMFYGLVLLGTVVTMFFPELQNHSRRQADQMLSEPGLMTAVANAYVNSNVLVAISLTFLINLAVSLVVTTLPSFVVPFVGILVVVYRAVVWGFLFSPIGSDRAALVPHGLTLVVEGQAYVLAAFAAYIQGCMFLWPSRYGLESRWDGYKTGAVATVWLYALIALTLLIGAIDEGIEVIYLVPLFL